MTGTAVLTAALLSLGARTANAGTINIDLSTLSGVSIMSNGNWSPTILDDGTGLKTLSYLSPADWADFPFTVPAGQGGVYTIAAKYGTPNPITGDTGLPVAITLEVRKVGAEAHITSEDLVLAPTGIDDAAYIPSASFSAPGFDLAPGDYVLRIRNVSMAHTVAGNRGGGYQWRAEINAGANRRVDINNVALTSTGALPSTGTISGKLTASDLGYGIQGAFVMAVPAGKEVAEPSPFWQGGHWTMTDASGNYTLPVPAGTYTVQAGRPDSYQLAGVRATDVAVTAGATTTKDLSLKSNWNAVDGTGSIQVEEEYFFDKIPDPLPDLTMNSATASDTNIDLNPDGNSQNQIKLSWTGTNDYVDVYVDVPTGQGGPYDLSIIYTSFPAMSTVEFTANPDDANPSTISADLPNSGLDENDPSKGYWVSNTVTAPTPITLHEGRNVVREKVVSGGPDFDAFTLRKNMTIPTGPGIANPKDAINPFVMGEQGSGVVGYPVKDGNTVQNLIRGGWVEIPMTFSGPGMYKAVVSTATPKAGSAAVLPDTASIQLDLRPDDGTNAHYATGDVTIPVADSFSNTTVTDIPVLSSGNYILRVRNTTQLRSTANNRGVLNSYGGSGFISTRVDFGAINFTRTGDLPAKATLIGTVKSGNLNNLPIPDAEVMANPTGAGVLEPSTWWVKGFWTTTDANGAYTLPVLAGTYDVQAGQAAAYAYAGGMTPATVAASGSATANIDLPSRMTQDATGHYQINVECEYFTGKPTDLWGSGYAANVIAFQENGSAHNGIALGYTDGGDWLDIPVDVPVGAGGEYTLTDYYFNGYWNGVDKPDGNVSFTANLGTGQESVTTDVQPNTSPTSDPSGGYNTPGSKVFGSPITLQEGHNIIRIKLDSGSSNFDAFMLTSSATFPQRPSALKALRISAGMDLAPTPASGTAFKALDMNSDGSITSTDVVMLLRAGYL